jgi:HD-GYP domain-containing protein (c-di-GMP phosphodiesterase class II)
MAQGETMGEISLGRKVPWTEADQRLLVAIADMAASAWQRASLFEQTQRRLKHLQALRAVDETITGSLDMRLILNVLLDQISAHLRVDAVDILLLNVHTQTLNYFVGHGFRTNKITRSLVKVGEGHAGRVALERRSVYIPDNFGAGISPARAAILAGEGFAAYYGVPLIAKGQVKGVLEIFHREPFTVAGDWLEFLDSLAGQAAIAIDNTELFKGLQRSSAELLVAYDTTLLGWSKALDLRDKETEGHTQRVTEITVNLARASGLSEPELLHVRRGALLHDVGKLGIPDSILLKPGPLTEAEWVVMRQHPTYVFEWLSPIAYLRPALDIPWAHHEKWDGTGYPRGLRGAEIPLAARIFAVVDVWDALRSDRPYRQAWPEEKVLEHIRTLAGTHFDPQVVKLFLDHWQTVVQTSIHP